MATTRPDTPTRQLGVFLALACLLSWPVTVPLALAVHGLTPAVFPPWAAYLAALGPGLAALLLAWRDDGLRGMAQLGQQLAHGRVCPKWWVTAFSPLLVGFVVVQVLNRLTGTVIDLGTLGAVPGLPELGAAALPLWLFTFALGGEIGWRGYALPRLQRGRSALTVALIVGLMWSVWSLPLFALATEPLMLAGWVLALLAGSVVLTWLYNSTGDSLLMTTLCHGGFAYMVGSTAVTGLLPIVAVTLLIGWAVAATVLYSPKYLMSI